uniref:Uncharacterized protein n=1 Tax=viral metagenome TaxID=1070528 RepID=A0A6H1ZJJ3_9ZZZZ
MTKLQEHRLYIGAETIGICDFDATNRIMVQLLHHMAKERQAIRSIQFSWDGEKDALCVVVTGEYGQHVDSPRKEEPKQAKRRFDF